MAGLLLLLVLGGAVFETVLVAYAAWTLTHPPRKTYSWAVARGRPGDPGEMLRAREFSSWSFRTRKLDLAAWTVRGDAISGPIVIVTHGWGDSRIGGLVRLEALATWAREVVLWDLPGHAEARGVCSLGVREVDDLCALIEQVSGEGVPIVLYGWSLGAGVSICAAARRGGIAGVIAEAPYRLPATPARNVMRINRLPYRLNLPIAMWLLGMAFGVGPRWRGRQDGVGFDRALHAARIRSALLVLHGTDDEICPFEDGRTIEHAAPDSELARIEGAMHNNLWTEETFARACAEAIARFARRMGFTSDVKWADAH